MEEEKRRYSISSESGVHSLQAIILIDGSAFVSAAIGTPALRGARRQTLPQTCQLSHVFDLRFDGDIRSG